MRKIVFVCTGNTCRSPMAEGMFRMMAEKYGLQDVECTSCGTDVYVGMPVSAYAVTAAAEKGADISGHRARALTESLLSEADLFVCMTKRHAELLKQYLPEEKVCVLGDGIGDPFGGELEDYRDCAAEIYTEIEAWVRKEAEKQK